MLNLENSRKEGNEMSVQREANLPTSGVFPMAITIIGAGKVELAVFVGDVEGELLHAAKGELATYDNAPEINIELRTWDTATNAWGAPVEARAVVDNYVHPESGHVEGSDEPNSEAEQAGKASLEEAVNGDKATEG